MISTIPEESIKNIPAFSGKIWYVSKNDGSDSNSGENPDAPFETIGKAISSMSAGDAVRIKGGAYIETGIDVSKANSLLWFETGTTITPASGTALTVSGNHCKIWNPGHPVNIFPAANQTGVLVSGDNCSIHDIRVFAASSGAIGFDITGSTVTIKDCGCSNPLTAGFKVQGGKTLIVNGIVGAEPADTSIGYHITNSIDKYRLTNCSSQGSATAGFQIDAGCTNGVIKDCSSGGGDGILVDTDLSAVLSNYTFDDDAHTTQTFLGTGAGSKNLYKINGTVQVEFLYGTVGTVLAADVGNLKLEVFDGAAQNLTGTVSVNSLPVGSFLLKEKDTAKNLKAYSSASAQIVGNVDVKKQTFSVVQKTATSTYIRATWDGNAASGAIDWHLEWRPLSEDGLVTTV